MKKLLTITMLFIFISFSYAHGNRYEVLQMGIVGVKAFFNTGEPMAGARVLIFSPNTSVVYYKTETDKNGVVTFCPDKSGLWSLMIKDNTGHGMKINLEIDDTMSISRNQNNYVQKPTAFFQKIIMVICVLWGFIGTALFFRSKKGSRNAY